MGTTFCRRRSRRASLDHGDQWRKGFSLSPVELLLIAIGGCMGSDVVEILGKKRERVTDYRIEVGANVARSLLEVTRRFAFTT